MTAMTALMAAAGLLSGAVQPVFADAAGTPAGGSGVGAYGTKLAPVTELVVWPAALTLDGPRDARRFIVRGRRDNGDMIDVTRSVDITVRGGAAWWADGYLQPVADGTAVVELRYGPHTAVLPVTVRNAKADVPVSFAGEVMPVLGKTGCNSGTCHGAQAGRNGFKLSLRGYDPAADHSAIVDDLAGRRIDRHTPANSLVILKPTNGVPHEGKLLFTEDTRYYTLLRDWIAQGAGDDSATAPKVTGIEVHPDRMVLTSLQQQQQLAVIARYSDGRTRDVTRDAVYSSSADSVAVVSGGGLVTSQRRGEAAVLVRYEGQFAVAPLSVLVPVPGWKWSDAPTFNRLDELVLRKLKLVQMNPSALCDDAEFLRRAHLDLIGIPPTPEEVRAFLADKTDTRAKREKAVDALLARPEFVDFWTLKWADLLQVNRKFLGEKGAWAFRNWIARQVAADTPWNRVAAELLTAEGATGDNPPAAFYRIAKEPGQAVETTTHLFLGIRFNCNKCHDHPFERWTQGDYYNLAAFFGRTGVRKDPRDKAEELVIDLSGGEVKHLRTGQTAPPRFPYAAGKLPVAPTDTGGEPRRARLAEWLTSAENPYFARSMANRLWAHMTGRGIIDPVDDIRAGNPPSNAELLDHLTAEFVKSDFSIKKTLRLIATSRTYQLSIVPTADNADDQENFSHARPRRLSSEQLLDAVRMATGTRNAFAGLPTGFRASQLPDPVAGSGGFLEQFGRPVRESPCDCERRNEMSLGQALTLVNGPTVSEALAAPDGRVAKLLARKAGDDEIVEELYLAALGRMPTDKERATGRAALGKIPDKREAAQDLLWALLNTSAFLFNR